MPLGTYLNTTKIAVNLVALSQRFNSYLNRSLIQLLDTGPLWDSEARPKWYRVNPNLYYLIDHDQRSLSSNVV